MSLTTNNNGNQQSGAGQSGGANGIGAGNQGANGVAAGNQGTPNQITQHSQSSGGTAGIGGANAGVVGTGTGLNLAVAPAPVQPNVQVQNQTTPSQLILWDGNWPGSDGKIADYMSSNAGTPAAQKETAEKVFDFLKDPTSHLGVIGADTQPIAYLLHVAGTTNVCILYGLSPVIDNPFLSMKPESFRALMRDIMTDVEKIPGVMCLPASIVDVHMVEVPTDDYFFDKVADASIDKSAPWCKTGAAQDAMDAADKESKGIMKIVPVPLYTVLDGFAKDLAAAEVAERIKFLL